MHGRRHEFAVPPRKQQLAVLGPISPTSHPISIPISPISPISPFSIPISIPAIVQASTAMLVRLQSQS